MVVEVENLPKASQNLGEFPPTAARSINVIRQDRRAIPYPQLMS